jgi:hypothetical protein
LRLSAGMFEVCRSTSLIYLSPYIRGRFRLGLAVGVRSLTRPACSKCSKALDKADGSTGSEFRSWLVVSNEAWLRL